MAFFEVVGIASILPFMQLAADPDSIHTNPWLEWAYNSMGFSSERSMLITTGIAMIALITVSNLFSAFTVWLQQKYSWAIAHNLSVRLLGVHVNQPYQYFLSSSISNLKSDLVFEVSRITSGVITPLNELISRLVVILVIFLLLVFVNPFIAFALVSVLGGAYILIYLARQRYLNRLGEERILANQVRFKNLDDLLNGIKTIRVFQAQDYFFSRFESASERFSDIMPRVLFISASPKYVIEILAFGSILAIALYLIINGDGLQAALPILSLYAVAGYRLLPSLQKAFGALAKLRHNFHVVDIVYKNFKNKNNQITEKQNINPIEFKQSIKLKDIVFKYSNTPKPLIENLSLTIAKGSTVAFVGSTGSGKTTVTDLLVGLLFANAGQVLVDETSITEANAEAWRHKIAYVPQEVFLFDDTIEKNIAIGTDNEGINPNKLKKATQVADIYSFITQELPMGFQTTVGERGVRLSGGQKQRLGLARALYKTPELLVLDEATSALDGITEKNVIEALKQLAADLTIVLIAHRLSTVRHADQIFLLDGGNLVATGTYEELLQKSELFRTMVELA